MAGTSSEGGSGPESRDGGEVEAFDARSLSAGNRGVALSDPEVEQAAEALLHRLSMGQKVAQMHGESFEPTQDLYTTASQLELGIPPFKMVDGPRGVRAGTATTFPVAMARGASWDPTLEMDIGQAIAKEARARGANVLLAPAINLLRHPGWGRAQETYGEDPVHVGRMGAAFVAGAQRELVASVKHFALNSIEDSRFEVDVQVDEGTLREVYLPHFEQCVRDAHAGAVMSAYNRVNGRYCAENPRLLGDILKGEWGFRGFVVSDWVFGTRSTQGSIDAGLDVEMPEAHHYGRRLLHAVRAGRVSPNKIDDAVRRILRVKLAFRDAPGALERATPPLDVIECMQHQDLALRAAHRSMVLLKNQRMALPLDVASASPLAVVGRLAALENTGDRGSSGVRSSFVISALEGITDRLGVGHVRAFPRDVLTAEDRVRLSRCEAAVVVVGLTWREEGERIPFWEGGGDRTDLRLPNRQELLVREVSALVPRTIVVIEAGSAVELRNFVDAAPAVLMAWYPGMLGGEALADVLFGRVAPSGKLPCIFSRHADDLVPFDPRAKIARYQRYHGYRHHLLRAKEPEFPFGYGLSYTRFRYENLAIQSTVISRGEPLVAHVRVRNVGSRPGDEVVQLYLRGPHGSVPLRLVGFGRLDGLRPGQAQRLRLVVGTRELARFDAARGALGIEPGPYRLFAGPSSGALPLSESFAVV